MTPPNGTLLSPTGQRVIAATPLITIITVPEIALQPTTAAPGMTGIALRTANDTITKMHTQAIAQRKVIEQLRDALAEAGQENEVLREQLDFARRMSQP